MLTFIEIALNRQIGFAVACEEREKRYPLKIFSSFPLSFST